jgi:hypothetical protein
MQCSGSKAAGAGSPVGVMVREGFTLSCKIIMQCVQVLFVAERLGLWRVVEPEASPLGISVSAGSGYVKCFCMLLRQSMLDTCIASSGWGAVVELVMLFDYQLYDTASK